LLAVTPTRHPKLPQPLDPGFTTLRNGIVMGSMHTGLEDRFWNYPKLAAYFRERARGGVGLMVTIGCGSRRREMTTKTGENSYQTARLRVYTINRLTNWRLRKARAKSVESQRFAGGRVPKVGRKLRCFRGRGVAAYLRLARSLECSRRSS